VRSSKRMSRGPQRTVPRTLGRVDGFSQV
jgi:hypothetical protein